VRNRGRGRFRASLLRVRVRGGAEAFIMIVRSAKAASMIVWGNLA
jgi:hypothetical protein